jgi:hypothetical protein
MAEIENELAESRLRRSRMANLNAELDYLRSSYSLPSWSWRDYYLWERSYYTSLYPYTYPYTYPYSYPYSSLYLRPYRWWWL